MEITQRDRDSLRQAQQRLNSSQPFQIGSIVEHKIQDPSTYKAKSRQEQGLAADARPALPRIHYKSAHLDRKESSEQSHTIDKPMDSNDNDDDQRTMPAIDEKDELHMNLPITPGDVQANLWLNMDRVEFEKLEWMSNKADKEYFEQLRSSIHFDSDGKAIPPPANESETPQQHVHDISSLVKLLDSAFHPQVTYALNVISKIATRATLGLYDAVFDENIHQVLLKECILRVRHHIDSTNETICQCALRCARSLLCNTQIDEIFMDKLSAIKSDESDITMWLSSNQEDFEIDMKDNDCVHVDVILGLIARTDILARFKYLLNTKTDPKFSRTYHDCILDILIRFARYSQDLCWILNTNEFPKLIIERFLPTDIVLMDPLQQSLALRGMKFLRIIAQAAKELRQSSDQSSGAPVIKLPSSLPQIINSYYYIDSCGRDSANNVTDVLFRIQIETLRLMRSLASVNEYSGHVFSTLALDQSALVRHVRALTQLSVLTPIESPSSLDWQYAASLLDLLGHMMNHERLHSASSFIKPLWLNFIRPQTMQWFNDLIREKIIPHQDVSIALHVAANIFNQLRDKQMTTEFYYIILQHSNKIRGNPTAETSLIYFRYLLREATHGSQLEKFLETNGRRRDPVMLPSYGFMDFNTSNQYSYKLNSIIGKNSPYILLNLYFIILQQSCSQFDSSLPYYLDNLDLVRYMRIAACYHKYPSSYESKVQRSVLAQLEVRILANASLLLSKYYLKPPTDDDSGIDNPKDYQDLLKNRTESYSQLLLHVFSIIGLINPQIESMLTIKDALLEKVIFSDSLHSRLVDESYAALNNEVYKGMKFNDLQRHKYDGELSENFSLDESDLLVMKSIYLSCEQPGRFWIFQPLIEYYFSQIQGGGKTKRVEGGKWFLQNINKNFHGKLLPADCDDVDVIYRMLKLNVSLMHQSASYFQMAIIQNIEEYLCLIGSVFLDDDLFLDRKINRVLWHNLEMILIAGMRHGVNRVFGDASKKISTLNLPLIDFFDKLANQYEAASYNDIVFTNFLLLFLSSKCDKTFKKKLFSDKLESCLSQVRIAHSEVLIPESLMFQEKESDPEIKCLIKLSAIYVKRSSFLDYYRRYHTS
uniref:RNA polymerase II-associated protein 1 n=1 Tax=Aceria tosichella TaxID=561515 RepID=A0A6G1SJ55_9ACAR